MVLVCHRHKLVWSNTVGHNIFYIRSRTTIEVSVNPLPYNNNNILFALAFYNNIYLVLRPIAPHRCSGSDKSRYRKKRKAISIMQIKVRETLHGGWDLCVCVCVCVIYARGDDYTAPQPLLAPSFRPSPFHLSLSNNPLFLSLSILWMSFYTPRAISFANAGEARNLTVYRGTGRTTGSDILRCIRTLHKGAYIMILLILCL